MPLQPNLLDLWHFVPVLAWVVTAFLLILFTLTWKASEFGKNTRFIELAGEINTTMPDYVISKVADALNDEGKALKASKILVLGLAYKGNVDDCRESPSFVLMEKLKLRVQWLNIMIHMYLLYPPPVSMLISMVKNPLVLKMLTILILLSTDHLEYKDFDFSNYSCPFVDTRNCISKRPQKYYKA